jgi:hypothetical protein
MSEIRPYKKTIAERRTSLRIDLAKPQGISHRVTEIMDRYGFEWESRDRRVRTEKEDSAP